MFLSKSFVKTVLIYIFVAFFQILTYLFFNDWYIFGPQLTARTKKTEKIFPFPLIFPFQVHFFTHEVPKCDLVVIFQYENHSRSLFCPLIYGPPLYTHFLLLFPAPGSSWSLGSSRYGDYGLRLRLNMLLRIIKTT